MEGTITDMFAQGLDAFITSLIVSFMVIMLSQQQSMATVVSENHVTALEMQEYREYNAYDHRHCYAADVISLILSKKGYPEIEVIVGSNTYKFTLTSNSINYNVDDLYRAIDPRYLYDADVTYTEPDRRLGVEKIRFKSCAGNAGCGY